MPRSATFSVTAASAHSSAHNSREEKPKYLIGTSLGSENVYDLRHSDSDFLALAEVKYKETTGQKMQQKQKDALIKETVLSLEAHHTEADVQKVFDELAGKYGGHYITELSIHRDEGHFEDENGITYYPTKDILQKGNEWYRVPLAESITHLPEYRPKAEEFSEKVDIKDFKPVHNHHAHVKFSMFDPRTGKTGRMQHKDLNDRIRTAARVLKLEYNPEKKNDKRVTVADTKAQHKAVRNEKVRNFLAGGGIGIEAKNREITRLEYNFREAQKRISAMEALDAEQKKELHRLNTEINKTKDDEVKVQKITELEKKLTESTEIALKAQNILSEAQDTIEAQSSVIERLKAKETTNNKLVTTLAENIGVIRPTTLQLSTALLTERIEQGFVNLKEKHAEELQKHVAEIKGERAEKEVFADMVAEIHHAYEHEPREVQSILDRQQVELAKAPKPAYKTALQRRDEAYKERIGREPKRSYSSPRL